MTHGAPLPKYDWHLARSAKEVTASRSGRKTRCPTRVEEEKRKEQKTRRSPRLKCASLRLGSSPAAFRSSAAASFTCGQRSVATVVPGQRDLALLRVERCRGMTRGRRDGGCEEGAAARTSPAASAIIPSS